MYYFYWLKFKFFIILLKHNDLFLFLRICKRRMLVEKAKNGRLNVRKHLGLFNTAIHSLLVYNQSEIKIGVMVWNFKIFVSLLIFKIDTKQPK